MGIQLKIKLEEQHEKVLNQAETLKKKSKIIKDKSKIIKENKQKLAEITEKTKNMEKELEETNKFLKESNDELICPICLELMVYPCTIKCGHSYCEVCIVKYCQGKTNDDLHEEFCIENNLVGCP